ncbi:MAG: hypothetical protein ABEK03_11280 [Candidatus Bipolaricaulia bacterium]
MVPDRDELFTITDEGYERVAHLRTFPLPGGHRAIKEPRRSALGLLYERFGDDAFEMDHLAPIRSFTSSELKVLKQSLKQGINAPRTSSVGRLFDAVASLCDLRQTIDFEGEAAMALEFALDGSEAHSPDNKGLHITSGEEERPWTLDWAPILDAVLADLNENTATAGTSARFHDALATAVCALAERAQAPTVVLTGGCFQNPSLQRLAERRLRPSSIQVYGHGRTPSNDGGVALGQLISTSVDRQAGNPGESGSTSRRAPRG